MNRNDSKALWFQMEGAGLNEELIRNPQDEGRGEPEEKKDTGDIHKEWSRS